MKKILYLLTAIALCFTFTNCSDDDWTTDPALEHIYYVGFQQWFSKTANDVVYNVNRGATLEILVQFYSERTRSYDVSTYYYVTPGTLALGTDFQVVDANGSALQPDANGAYKFDWPKAVKGVQKIYIKALNGKVGAITVYTFDPNAGAITHPDNITNSKTNDYEVRSFTQNYKVAVNIK